MMIKISCCLICLSLLAQGGIEAKETLSDPTRPPSYATEPAKKKIIRHLKLSTIRINEHQKMVIINGKLLKKGQSIGGYQVKSIAAGHVILVNTKGTLRLNLINSRIIRKKL